MNGGMDSTLPVRNPITRPVSLHSLPEHQRSTPTYLSPHSHRRPRTPRSSPLAGPSLSSDQVDSENKDDEGGQKPRYRPNRISSTPDMVLPIQSLYDSDVASLSSLSPPPSLISNGTIGVVVPRLPIPKSSSSSGEDDKEKELGKGEEVEDGNKLRSLAKRPPIISTSSIATNEKDKDDQKANKQRSSFNLHSTSTTSLASTSSSRTAWTDKMNQTTPPIPTIPRWALNAMREEAGIANRNAKYGHRCGASDDFTTSSSLPPLPNQPIPRGIRMPISGISTQLPFPSVSRDPRENWMSVTDPTPKFSRLGLGGDGVVMPVRKRESLAKMKSAGSIRSTRSTATPSRSAGARRDSEVTSRTEPILRRDSCDESSASNTRPNLKGKEALRKRPSLASSLKAKIPKISVSSSAESENVPPLPPTITKSGPISTSVTNSHMLLPASNDFTPETSISPPPIVVSSNSTRRSATLKRDNVLAAINENQLPSPSPNDTHTEFGRIVGDLKSQNTQRTRTRRKSIKQIVMRITAAPMSIGEKLKLEAVHNSTSTPVAVLPPDTLMPPDSPPGTRFEKTASSSVPSLPSTKVVSEPDYNQGEMCTSKRFKSIRRRWNAVLATVRG